LILTLKCSINRGGALTHCNYKRKVRGEDRRRMENKKNPYIENFCRIMVKKKGENLPPEGLDRAIDHLYRLFENMLGRNMVAALPEELQSQYISLYEKDGDHIDYEQIAQIFGSHISNPKEIMRKTLKEFAEIYNRNR